MSARSLNEAGLVVVMLLDNHYAPDPRVQLETRLLRAGGFRVRIVAWDRRASSERAGSHNHAHCEHGEDVIRIAVPAPPGGGWRSLLRMLRFAHAVRRRESELLGDAAVVVAHDIYLLPLGWLLARRFWLPLIYDAHEDFAAMEAGRYPRLLLRLVTAVETFLARRATAVVVPGRIRVDRWTAVGISPCILPNLGRETGEHPEVDPHWDIVYCGTLGPGRRLDLLIELARCRPDLRIAIAGGGRSEEFVRDAAAGLLNLEFRSWIDDSDTFLAAGRSVYYGLDPTDPYSNMACPNTLYQAIRVRRPLVFFCDGEPRRAAEEFAIGIRCEPSVESIAGAVDAIRERFGDWEFDAAWKRLASSEPTTDYVAVFEEIARTPAATVAVQWR